MILVGDWCPGMYSVILNTAPGLYFANLEGPIFPQEHAFTPCRKAGPNLFSSELPNDDNDFIFALANNHSMDYGFSGLEATSKLLHRRGFRACGAGQDLSAARQPIVIEDGGSCVGIISCCEAQFGVARYNSGGVAAFGPWVYHAIRDLRETVDVVIVSVHAAIEDAPWPPSYIRELYHAFIDAGALVVHGHHAHVPQGYEVYGEGVIFYGMGNFAIAPEKWRNYPNAMWSLGAEVDFSSKPIDWRLLTFEIRERHGSDAILIEESSREEQLSHRHYLEMCNQPFKDPDLFEALWQEVALRAYYDHGAKYMGFSVPSRLQGVWQQIREKLSFLKKVLLNKRTPFSLYSPPGDYMLRHVMFACESHRQMLTTALGILAGEIKDVRTEESRRLADEMMPWSCGVLPI